MSPHDGSLAQDNASHNKRRESVVEEHVDYRKRRRLRTQSNDQTDSHFILPPTYLEASHSEDSSISALKLGGLRPLDDAIITDTTNGMLNEPQTLHPIQPLISSLRLLPVFQNLGLSCTTEEADRLIIDFRRASHSTQAGTRRLLDVASGFYGAHPTNEVLFPLFFLMATEERFLKRYFYQTVSCIYSTITTNDIKLLQELLLEALSDTDGHQSRILDRFLLQISLIMLYKQHDINDCYKEQIGKATSIFYGIDNFVRCKRSNPELMQLDITSYNMVYLAFGFLGVGDSRQSINDAFCWEPLLHEMLEQAVDCDLEVLEDEFLHQIPGPFELVDESLQNPCLRNCLKWCKSRLKMAYRLPPTLEELRHETIHKEWAESIAVYWYLWIEYFNTPNALNIGFFGTKSSEQVMGIPAAQLLFNMATLIMDISPPEKRYSRLIRRDVKVIQRAIAGAVVLERMSDEEFARRFLSQLVDKDVPFYLPADLASSKVHLAATQAFHAGTITNFAYLQRPDAFLGVGTLIRQPSLSATLASSHSSSTFSSMRRLAVGISKHSRAPQRPSRSNSRTSALTVDGLSDTLSVLTFSTEPFGQSNSAWLSRTSI
jgi:hypothetical protein